ncbi:MAG: hypothetical protein ACOCV1_02565 [Bacillota bacterium]
MKSVKYQVSFYEDGDKRSVIKCRLSKALKYIEKKMFNYMKEENIFNSYSSIRYQLIYSNLDRGNGKRFGIPDLKMYLSRDNICGALFFIIMQNGTTHPFEVYLDKLLNKEVKNSEDEESPTDFGFPELTRNLDELNRLIEGIEEGRRDNNEDARDIRVVREYPDNYYHNTYTSSSGSSDDTVYTSTRTPYGAPQEYLCVFTNTDENNE